MTLNSSSRGGLQGVLLATVLLGACRDGAPPPAAGRTPEAPQAAEWFVERAAESSLDFVHFNGRTGRAYEVEIFGPGVALFDYDNDDDLDAFVVQGRVIPADAALSATTLPRRASQRLEGRLFRNDLHVNADGTRDLRFTDVTEASGIHADGYGMGVATGDINNDGWIDLYVTNVGPNQMFLNNRNGTFTDVSKSSGTNDSGWGASATFFDIDRDGWMDLFVGNYLTWSAGTDVSCSSETGAHDYCGPTTYRPQQDRLYRNRGDGTFADVTSTALRGSSDGPALGVIASDFNDDGWPDVYVANDGHENQLWINQRNGTFTDGALRAGLAVNGDGKPTASMGVDAGDYDNDGDDDIFITNWAGETNTLHVQTAPGVFEDRTTTSGLGPPSIPFTGFGTAWADFDNDTWLDLFVANGAVITKEALARLKDPFPYHEVNHLYRNLGSGRFEEIGAHAGSAFALSEVSRGAAFGDVDNDGDLDVLVGNNNGPLRLMVNTIGNRNKWIGLALIGRDGHRTGALVQVIRADGTTLSRRARADGSWASANDPRVLVGLGPAAAGPPRVRVVWPGGRREEWDQVPLDRWTTLREGSGK